MKASGLDVHKDSIFCAIYDGKSYSTVKEFSTTTVSIRALGSYLESEKVKKVAMESTSTCWVPLWDILWETGFDLKSVNPLHIKQLPQAGRATPKTRSGLPGCCTGICCAAVRYRVR